MRKSKSSTITTPVDEACDVLYATFSRYAGSHVEGCPHCVSFEESAVLLRRPLRTLGSELDRYLFKAMTTWGTEDDFKYFLPRLLERYAMNSDAWLLCDKLAYARWRSWPEPERAAVERYLAALWQNQLASVGSPLPGDYLLETMLTLELDIAPYDVRSRLDEWRSDPSRDAAQRLADFVLEHGETLFWGASSNRRMTLWNSKFEMSEQVREWLLEKATRARLEEGFLTYGDRDVARAFDWLENISKHW